MKILRHIFSRMVLVSFAIAIQLLWLFGVLFYLSDYYLPIALCLHVISLIAVIFIINRPGNPQVKLAWIVPIMVFPLFGGIIFMISGGKGPKKKLRRSLDDMSREMEPYCPKPAKSEVVSEDEHDHWINGQCGYLTKNGFPPYRNTDAVYYADCRKGWEKLLSDLESAEHFIFMEYFIIRPGLMWDSILDVLKRKAAAGVDVRFMYDDLGSISCVPRDYPKQLEAMGIKCVSFNRYRPVYAVVMNHRDHRKITVVDGHIGYTGGANFADEYIGEIERFGVWKDNFLRIEGEGVRTLTLLFLQMWNAARRTDTREEMAAFLPKEADIAAVHCDGIVQPYGDSPVDNEILAENVYLNIINQATDYVYIMTPYVVIDYEMTRALSLAVGRGVDVRLIVPAIPDKKIVYHLTQSYFPELLRNGVKIYKYTPGFVHSKCFVADDRLAVVGTINTDYRSLTLHFEDACLFVDHPVVASVKADFDQTFPQSEELHPTKRRFNMLYELYLGLLRLFAPLM